MTKQHSSKAEKQQTGLLVDVDLGCLVWLVAGVFVVIVGAAAVLGARGVLG